MGRVRERWEDIRGNEQGQGAVGRHKGRWAGLGSVVEAYGVMGRVGQRLGRRMGIWVGSGSGGEA